MSATLRRKSRSRPSSTSRSLRSVMSSPPKMMFRAFPSSSEIGAVSQAIESSVPRASTNVLSNSIGR